MRSLRTWAILAAGALLLWALPARAVVFHFDYSTDLTGFFGAGNPQGPAAGDLARAALEAAGTFLGDLLGDDLAAIQPGGFNRWTAVYTHPATGAQAETRNLVVPEDTIWIYVGARDLGGNTLAMAGPGGYTGLLGSQTFKQAVINRGQGSTSTDFAPWGGSMAFDIDSAWHYDHTTLPGGGYYDLFSVALHELGHVLGFGLADSWEGWVQNHLFSGPEAVAVYGANVPLTSDDGHWLAGLQSTIFRTTLAQEAAMDPDIAPKTRKHFTDLDVAALDDIGWQINPPATLIWNGPTGLWGSANWLSGTQFVAPAGREQMVVQSGAVSIDRSYTGVWGAVALSLSGGRVDVLSGAALDVFGPVSVGAGAALAVDGILAAESVAVAGPGISGGVLSGRGTLRADVTVGGIISPGAFTAALSGFSATSSSSLAALSAGTGDLDPAGDFSSEYAEDSGVLPRLAASSAQPLCAAQTGAPVPEPAAWLLLLAALPVLIASGRHCAAKRQNLPVGPGQCR